MAKATHTVKIGSVWYKAGDELPAEKPTAPTKAPEVKAAAAKAVKK